MRWYDRLIYLGSDKHRIMIRNNDNDVKTNKKPVEIMIMMITNDETIMSSQHDDDLIR